MWMIVIAILLDFLLGDPLWFPHPIIFIGKMIHRLENLLYKKESKARGALLTVLCLIIVYGVIEIGIYISSFLHIDTYVVIFFLYTSLAIQSLAKAGREVVNGFAIGIDEARLKLSYIVGRDTKELNEQAILKGTIETIAENTIDGSLAPLFYMIMGLYFQAPLQFVFLYKTVNTLDSMIGYKNEKYSNFGFFAAKLDDVLNFIPARLGSLIMLIAGAILGYDVKEGIKVFFSDRKNHTSPNSAHAESVIAGLLHLQLGGPNSYFGERVEKPYIGHGKRKVTKEDITKTNRVLYVSNILIMFGLLIREVLL